MHDAHLAAGCCEEDGFACLEFGSTAAKDHSIDWALVKGRHSNTGTCYVKGSTDEATPYVTEDTYVLYNQLTDGHTPVPGAGPPSRAHMCARAHHTPTPTCAITAANTATPCSPCAHA